MYVRRASHYKYQLNYLCCHRGTSANCTLSCFKKGGRYRWRQSLCRSLPLSAQRAYPLPTQHVFERMHYCRYVTSLALILEATRYHRQEHVKHTQLCTDSCKIFLLGLGSRAMPMRFIGCGMSGKRMIQPPKTGHS